MNDTIYAPGCEGLDPAQCVRQSYMKVLAASSLAHVWSQYLDPDRKPESSRQQELGTLVHALTLEPERFTDAFRIAPDANLTTIAGAQTLLAWLTEQANDLLLPVPTPLGGKLPELRGSILQLQAVLACHCTIVNEGDLTDARRMHAQLWAFPQIARILAHPGVQTETRILWRDESGAPCQATLDLHIAPCPDYPAGLIVDLKSTRSAQRAAFLKQAEQLAYHWQADFYRRAFASVYGATPPYVWVAVENAAPFCANLIPCGNELCAYARTEYYPHLQVLSSALASGNWPGYAYDPTPAMPSRWMVSRHERGE
jgi:hypothetical protein